MASMVFSSSPFSVQSFVKQRTNSNYHHSSCYVPSPSRANNYSYVHLSYKNISHIESSKSSFTKGDSNFSFSLPKFPRFASTLSPSLSIVKACNYGENIYHFQAYDMKKKEDIYLDRYRGTILLFVNIPRKGSKWAKPQIELLNDLRKLYEHKRCSEGGGFEVLGFLHDDELNDESEEILRGEEETFMGEQEILDYAEFPIFGKVKVNDNHDSFLHNIVHFDRTIQREKDEDVWYFLRKTLLRYDDKKNVNKIKQSFQAFLVDGAGNPIPPPYPRYDGASLRSKPKQEGGDPGNTGVSLDIDLTFPPKNDIDAYFKKSGQKKG